MFTVNRYYYGIYMKINIFIFIFTTILQFHAFIETANSFRWIGMYSEKNIFWNDTKICKSMRMKYRLTAHQGKLCRRAIDTMPYVQMAALTTIETCEKLFEFRRWNCSNIRLQYLHNFMKGTREGAAVELLSAGALEYMTARACAAGKLHQCSCSNHPNHPPNGDFKWGGCGDNIDFGIRFAAQFVRKRYRRKKRNGRFKMGKKERDNELMARINSHNHNIARNIVRGSATTFCKCHGVSGSCSVKTCWQRAPTQFVGIKDKVLYSYDNAKVVEVPRDTLAPKYTNLLLYKKKSPNYCVKNSRIGSYGTSGRECNLDDDMDCCDDLCCNRGYKSYIKEVEERCRCTYIPDLYNVTCEICLREIQVKVCN